MKLIRRGKIVLEHEILEGYALVIEHDRIKDIIKEDVADDLHVEEVFDACGGYITPGFIDIHSDYIEKMAAPRKTSVMDMQLAVYEFEKECCSHGITTMFHSVSMLDNELGTPMRNPENVKKLVEIIEESHSQLHLIHNRFHMRFEIDNFTQFPLMMEYLKKGYVHLLSFMDHTPGQGQYRDLEIYKKTYLVDDKGTRSEEEIEEMLKEKMNTQKLTMDAIRCASDLAKEKEIAVASHDDDTIEKLDVVQSFGATISEFPITLEVAKEAKNRGMYTVVGAPNILLGGSHSGNMSARDAIEAGCADILCSDYYPASLLHSVFKMEEYGQKLEDMIAKVTIQPARAAQIDHICGSIEKNKKADLLIIMKLPNGLPAITHVFVDGQLTQRNHYRM